MKTEEILYRENADILVRKELEDYLINKNNTISGLNFTNMIINLVEIKERWIVDNDVNIKGSHDLRINKEHDVVFRLKQYKNLIL